MRLTDTIRLFCYGTSEGASKGWDTRGRGRKNPEYVYHVTFTAKVSKIQREGLRPMQTSNWVKAADQERYGQGEIYSFEHPEDALRWAAKMDWEFNRQIGTGKVSILKVKTGDEAWRHDEADPLGQGGAKGRWLKYLGVIPGDRIVSSLPVTTEHVRKLTGNEPFEF